jgi:hypothetical protein
MTKYVDRKELNKIQNTSEDVQAQLFEHGGAEGLLSKLKVDILKGLSNDDKKDLVNRQKQFGVNQIDFSGKSCISLMLEIFQDQKIVILIIYAIICFVLSLIHANDPFKTGYLIIFFDIYIILLFGYYRRTLC